MRHKIFWRSWSQLESDFELSIIKSLPLKNIWLNGYAGDGWNKNDIWLTTNGNDYLNGAKVNQFSWYAESFYYLQDEYNRYNTDIRFKHRFHFNPNYCLNNTTLLPIYCWWSSEISTFKDAIAAKKPEYMFGMVLGKKPPRIGQPDCYFGWIREEIVKASKDRSFKYYGYGWSGEDKNYGGEAYIKGQRSSPQKFNDARKLMSKCKFVWATENTHDKYYSINYMTEKIFHGFLSASVPIYCGAWNIENMIDASLFIDLRRFDYNLKAVMDYCERMSDSEYNGYLSRIGDFLEHKGQEFTGESRFKQLDNVIYNVVI